MKISLLTFLGLLTISIFFSSWNIKDGDGKGALRRKKQNNKCIECHSDLSTNKVIHAPVQDDCSNCHKQTGEKHPKDGVKGFSFELNTYSLCIDCHSDKIEKKKLHLPYEQGECITCHLPHSSENPSLLADYPVSNICYMCHELNFGANDKIHAPVEMGSCEECHDPHQSDYAGFLKDEKSTICTNCHDNIKTEIESKYPHAAAVDDCSNCHNPHSSPNNAFLNEKAPALCLMCHEVTEMKHNHPPVQEGECLMCHNPHGSKNKYLLAESEPGELCMTCHDTGISDSDIGHAPVMFGECIECHSGHNSNNYALLKSNDTKYCFNCHTDLAEKRQVNNIHPPFEDDCATCHAAHKSSEPKLLIEKSNVLCLMCHDNVQEQINHKPIVHAAIYEKGSCVKCHSPHASKHSGLLNKSEKELCLSCHNQVYNSANGSIKNIKKQLTTRKNIHAPVDEGCSVCHSAHAEKRPYLLTSPFPPINYVPANKQNFALCFECHDSDLMTVKTSKTVTDFRNGDQNLHYMHLKGKKARNCNMCHEVHSSDNDNLIVNKIWFGQWQMPFEYESHLNGGSCNTGCHEKKEYYKIPDLK